MPTRDIKESCRTSETLAKITPAAERFFWRLLTYADDYGRFPARADVLRAQCFSVMLAAVQQKDVSRWLSELFDSGLVYLYKGDDGKEYGEFVTWRKHQRVRAKHSKYPARTSADICPPMPADDVVSPKKPSTTEETERSRRSRVVLSDDQFLMALRSNPAYKDLDIDREMGKLDAWLLTPKGRGKQKTRQRVVNWLNGADQPMSQNSRPTISRKRINEAWQDRQPGAVTL